MANSTSLSVLSRAPATGERRAGEKEGEPVAVAAGFEAPIFGARIVGQVTTLALEGEDGPLASLELRSVGSDHPSRLRTRCCTSRRPGACAPWQPVKAAPASPLARMGARCLRAHALI